MVLSYLTSKIPDIWPNGQRSEVSLQLSYTKFSFGVLNLSVTFQAKGDSTDQTTMDIDFYVDKDMVHISDTKIARHYGDYYVQQVLKLKESNKLILGAALAPVVTTNTA